jgi:UDP-glucose 4-epimerase
MKDTPFPSSLVTGGAGFIGSHVTERLLAKGHSVVALDNLSGGYVENVPASARFVHGSVLDTALLSGLFKEHRFDYVFHFAAYAAEVLSHHIKRFNYTNNLIGSVNLINEAVQHKVRCFVFASSAAVYGSGEDVCREDSPAHPEDPYGIAKLAVERDLEVTRAMFGLDSIVFRFHNVFGERQNVADMYRNVVSIFLRQVLTGEPMTIFGDGEQTRSFTYIGDIVPYVANAIDLPAAYNRVFNLGGGSENSINELARCIAKAAGVERRVVYQPARAEVRHVRLDHTLAQDVLEFAPRTCLREGVDAMVRWLKGTSFPARKKFAEIELPEKLPIGWA